MSKKDTVIAKVAEAVEVKQRRVPKTTALSRIEKIQAWFSMNRVLIGKLLIALGTIVRVTAFFEDSAKIADTLAHVGEWVLLGGLGSVLAGASRPDDDNEERMHAKIRQRSQQFPAFRRRLSDRYRVHTEERKEKE